MNRNDNFRNYTHNSTFSVRNGQFFGFLVYEAGITGVHLYLPKFGRFDPYEVIGNQINLPPALINMKNRAPLPKEVCIILTYRCNAKCKCIMETKP